MHNLTPDLALARRFLAEHGPKDEVLLCGITGAHTYGFASPDSDIDMKGIHIVPTEHLLLLNPKTPPHDRLEVYEGVECDLTTHEVAHALSMLLKGNGNMLERILSPYQLVSSRRVEELQQLAQASIHRKFFAHYHGYFRGMQREHDLRRRAKTALYTYRVALTGIHLLQTGELITDIRLLAAETSFANITSLVQFKEQSTEKATIPPELDTITEKDWPKLESQLSIALEESILPKAAPNRKAVEDWLIKLRKERL